MIGSLLSLRVFGFGIFLIFKSIFAVFVGGYLCAFMIKIIGSSAGGRDSPPDWPDVTDIFDDIVRPALLVVAGFLASFLPLIVYAIVSGGFGDRGAAFWAALALGVIYLPMALMTLALFESLAELNPVRVFVGIVRTCPAYLVVVVLFLLVSYLGLLVRAGASQRVPLGPVDVPLLAPFAAGAAWLYLLMVQMHLLGLLYQTHARRLGWFEG